MALHCWSIPKTCGADWSWTNDIFYCWSILIWIINELGCKLFEMKLITFGSRPLQIVCWPNSKENNGMLLAFIHLLWIAIYGVALLKAFLIVGGAGIEPALYSYQTICYCVYIGWTTQYWVGILLSNISTRLYRSFFWKSKPITHFLITSSLIEIYSQPLR